VTVLFWYFTAAPTSWGGVFTFSQGNFDGMKKIRQPLETRKAYRSLAKNQNLILEYKIFESGARGILLVPPMFTINKLSQLKLSLYIGVFQFLLDHGMAHFLTN
jgi:hypothetical protein